MPTLLRKPTQVVAGNGTDPEPEDPLVGDPPVASPTVWLLAGDTDRFTYTDGLISSWADQSGNGNHATPPAAINRPPAAILPSDLLGVPVVCVDASRTALTMTSVSASLRQQTGFAVAMWTKDDGSNDASLIGCNDDGGRQFRINRGSGRLELVKAGVSTPLGSTLAVTKGTPFVASFRLDAALTEIRLNDEAAQSNTDGTTFTAARHTALGWKVSSGDPQPFMGHYAEVLIYNSTLTSQQTADTMAWLMERWGIV